MPAVTQESLLDLYNKLSRKHNTDYYGERVGPGWLKYEYNDAVWNLDDGTSSLIFRHERRELHPSVTLWVNRLRLYHLHLEAPAATARPGGTRLRSGSGVAERDGRSDDVIDAAALHPVCECLLPTAERRDAHA